MATVSASLDAQTETIATIVREAAATGRRLQIRGEGSKDFYGEPRTGEIVPTSGCSGVVDYDPAELVLTACAGTRLADIEALLAASGQMLPFEPPQFGGGTLGGCVATGLSGPRRPYSGAVRDFVLGVRLIDGRGNSLSFGGRVMKNVAGYDVSRLVVGSLGALGVLLEISLKVLPTKPELTLRFECDAAAAFTSINRWVAAGLPVTATCHHDRSLHVRFASSAPALDRICREVGGERVMDGARFWRGIRDQTDSFFQRSNTLWRVSVPATATLEGAAFGEQLVEWGGALRWISGDPDASVLRAAVEQAGGHATLFRASHRTTPVFHPLQPAVASIHRELKRVFDPAGVFCAPGPAF